MMVAPEMRMIIETQKIISHKKINYSVKVHMHVGSVIYSNQNKFNELKGNTLLIYSQKWLVMDLKKIHQHTAS